MPLPISVRCSQSRVLSAHDPRCPIGPALTPIGALLRGLAAGAIGTAAMDALLFSRYRRGGGGSRFAAWEFSSGLADWDDAPAPAQMGKRLAESLLAREIPSERAALVNNVMHWSYGLFWGAQYGLLAGSLRTVRAPVAGVAFGAFVWASDYVVLPLAQLYEPIWEYDVKTLADDLSAHIVFGLGAAATFELLTSE